MFHRKTDTKSKPQDLKPDFIAKLLTLFSHSTERGSALPMAVGLGVVMLGVTGVALMNSGRNKSEVASNEMTNQAIAAAEGGAVRIQEILRQQPRLAMADWFDSKGNAKSVDGIITSVNSGAVVPNGGACINIADAPSAPPALDSDEEEEVETLLTNPDNNTTIASAFQPLGADTEFKLVDLQKGNQTDLNAGSTVAVVTVQGRKMIGNTVAGIAQMNLEIPLTPVGGAVTESFPGTTFGPPGLWAQNFGKNPSSSGVRINANVLDSSECNPSATKTWDLYLAGFNTDPQNAFKAGGFKSAKSNLKFPSLPNSGVYSAPLVRTTAQKSSGATLVRSDESSPITSCPNKANLTLPRDTDEAVSLGTYVYNFDLSNCKNLVLGTGTEKIVIYSNGAIDTKNVSVAAGSTAIVHGNNGLTMNGNASLDDDNPQNFQIYIYNGDVSVGGTTETVGFIFAPNSTVNYGGTSAHFGAIWAGTVSGNGGGGAGGITATLTGDHLDDLLIDVTTETTPLPRTNPATRIIRTPVN